MYCSLCRVFNLHINRNFPKWFLWVRKHASHLTNVLNIARWRFAGDIECFLGAIAKLRRATVIFVMCVCLSAWNNSSATGRRFMKFDIWGFFENLSRKIRVWWKSDENNGYFTWRPMQIYVNISLNFLRMRNVSDNNCRENQSRHFMFSNLSPKIVPFMR